MALKTHHSAVSRYRTRALALLSATLIMAQLTACAAYRTVTPVGHLPSGTAIATPATATSLARYGRYTLIDMSPDIAQRDLLQQLIDVHVPATASASVGDALRYVLLHSGYRLCDSPDIRDFDSFPLPAAHVHLGPLSLTTTLQLLVGPGWQLESDETTRRVCFSRRESKASEPLPTPISRRNSMSALTAGKTSP